MVLRAEGDVVYHTGEPQGSWRHAENGDLVVNWHYAGSEEDSVDHSYHLVPGTNTWRLRFRGTQRIHDATLMFNKTCS